MDWMRHTTTAWTPWQHRHGKQHDPTRLDRTPMNPYAPRHQLTRHGTTRRAQRHRGQRQLRRVRGNAVVGHEGEQPALVPARPPRDAPPAASHPQHQQCLQPPPHSPRHAYVACLALPVVPPSLGLLRVRDCPEGSLWNQMHDAEPTKQAYPRRPEGQSHAVIGLGEVDLMAEERLQYQHGHNDKHAEVHEPREARPTPTSKPRHTQRHFLHGAPSHTQHSQKAGPARP